MARLHQDPEMPSGSPMWVAKPWPSSAAFPGALPGRCVGSGAATVPAGSPVLDASVTGDGLALHPSCETHRASGPREQEIAAEMRGICILLSLYNLWVITLAEFKIVGIFIFSLDGRG